MYIFSTITNNCGTVSSLSSMELLYAFNMLSWDLRSCDNRHKRMTSGHLTNFRSSTACPIVMHCDCTNIRIGFCCDTKVLCLTTSPGGPLLIMFMSVQYDLPLMYVPSLVCTTQRHALFSPWIQFIFSLIL